MAKACLSPNHTIRRAETRIVQALGSAQIGSQRCHRDQSRPRLGIEVVYQGYKAPPLSDQSAQYHHPRVPYLRDLFQITYPLCAVTARLYSDDIASLLTVAADWAMMQLVAPFRVPKHHTSALIGPRAHAPSSLQGAFTRLKPVITPTLFRTTNR